MGDGSRTTRFFSWPLMKENIRSNIALVVIIMLIMILMSTVVNFATSILEADSASEDTTNAQTDFYTYLFALASYDEMTGASLSYDDFVKAGDSSVYEQVFAMLSEQAGLDLSVAGFQAAIDALAGSDISLDSYVRQFEYIYALGQARGVFSGDELDIEEMMNIMLETMGVSTTLVDNLSSMDTTTLLNHMYFTVMGLLPILILIVVLANSLVADKIDRGSMVYVLSTPTKRLAVTITQALFMLLVPAVVLAIVCATRVATSFVFYDEVNVERIITLFVGMYILVEAVAGICYLASCLFNQSKHALAVGGGLTVWFFLASLLGMFGLENLVSMGVGVESLSIFNRLTLIGLFDVDSINTIGTAVVDAAYLWKLAVLAAIALVCYILGSVSFQKKDLPL